MVLGTPQHQLVNPDEPKKKAGMSQEDIARMESEMESLERDLKAVTDNYTENMFTLQTAQTYVKSLLKNAKVVRYLNANHAEIYSEFEAIAAAETVYRDFFNIGVVIENPLDETIKIHPEALWRTAPKRMIRTPQ